MTRIIQKAIKESTETLTRQESYMMMCHAQSYDTPMPSIERLREIVDLCREIIFPGYFGNTPFDCESMQHYIGVYLEKLGRLLSREVFAGISFINETNSLCD